ncbi:uncharacterized protein [Rutidosis leptorrhynchoides]|uniref:uncharacterized protein n=1 Tax=Rutidosis leptorrhynchoides TaxID=125765 RepID=UPI003A9A6410
MVNVYGPNNAMKKRIVWDKLMGFLATNEGEYVLFGDFNKVREETEGFRSIFHEDEANVFNTFISNSGLLDIPLGGRRFTWVNKSFSKMIRVDRVLVSPNVLNIFADLKLTTLARGLSDHLPIILQDLKNNFGPTPFKCFDSWCLYEEFNGLVKDAADEIMGCRTATYHDKMMHVKSKIKSWIKEKKGNEQLKKKVILARINAIEQLIESGVETEVERNERKDLIQELDTSNRIEDLDIIQNVELNGMRGKLKIFSLFVETKQE